MVRPMQKRTIKYKERMTHNPKKGLNVPYVLRHDKTNFEIMQPGYRSHNLNHVQVNNLLPKPLLRFALPLYIIYLIAHYI